MNIVGLHPFMHAAGWTLINSLWQAFILAAIATLLLRCIPLRFSNIRYAIACSSLAVTVLTSCLTFYYLSRNTIADTTASQTFLIKTASVAMERELSPLSFSDLIRAIGIKIQPYIPTILFAWCVGAMLCMLRMVTGWWYIGRMKREAIFMSGEWRDRLQQLTQTLKINRVVSLAESVRITTPMVIGFIKPVVLIPVEMISGLTTEQIETIFIHELAHIKRHDYVINIIQSVIEAIFFFNPFVWALSNIIRREREYCCDDAVVKQGSRFAYARALARLEERRLSKAMFALSLAENKNQLLNRIKRIMEKSGKNYSGKNRYIPALMVIAGLVCASWLTIQIEPASSKESNAQIEQGDTIIKKDEKDKRSRVTYIRVDGDGKVREKVVADFERDFDSEFEFSSHMVPINFIVPDFPDAPFALSIPDTIDAVPLMPDIPAIPGIEPFVFDYAQSDTIPGGFYFRNQGQWDEFSDTFEEKFKERFGDFYKKHEEDFEKMMDEIGDNFSEKLASDIIRQIEVQTFAFADEERSRAETESMQPLPRAEVWDDLYQEQEEIFESLPEPEKAQREEIREREQETRERSEELRTLEKDLRETERKMKEFKHELKEMLIKDGYLKTSEEIKVINWNDKGAIEINGKKIKENDSKKYHELHRKFFKGSYLQYEN